MAESAGQTSRRDRERERHRREILDAARRLVAVRGSLIDFTIEDVAREAEFAVGSIYRHFASKEELLDAMSAQVFEPLFAELEPIVAGDQPFEEQLRAVVRVWHRVLTTEFAAFRAFASDANRVGASCDQLATLRTRLLAAIDAVLAHGQREGCLAPGDRRVRTVALIGLITASVKWTALGALPAEDDPVEGIVSLFLDGARPRLAVAPAAAPAKRSRRATSDGAR